MLIFKCEADWAYAMSMKKAISTQEGQKQEEAKAGLKNQSLFNQQDKNSGRNIYRLKAHARKRFQAAFKSCKQLAGVIEEVLDSFSRYETQAYLEGMQASYLMEVEKWQEALDYLMRAKVIYQKVCQFKDSLEAVVYQEKIGQLDTFIRLCCVNLKLSNADQIETKLVSSLHEQI